MIATLEILHKIASHPWIYDRIQALAGRERVFNKISRQTVDLKATTVLDVGGGTGTWRRLWPEDCRYVCMDLETPKLKGFRSKSPTGLAVLSDAAQMCIATGSADVVTCVAVTHHLTDAKLDQFFIEASRVLKIGGRLILLDAVLDHARLAGRILWKLDRGSYPRSDEDLRNKMEGKFEVVHWEKFAIYHGYVFGIGVRP